MAVSSRRWPSITSPMSALLIVRVSGPGVTKSVSGVRPVLIVGLS
jgi:hypothetical protein